MKQRLLRNWPGSALRPLATSFMKDYKAHSPVQTRFTESPSRCWACCSDLEHIGSLASSSPPPLLHSSVDSSVYIYIYIIEEHSTVYTGICGLDIIRAVQRLFIWKRWLRRWVGWGLLMEWAPPRPALKAVGFLVENACSGSLFQSYGQQTKGWRWASVLHWGMRSFLASAWEGQCPLSASPQWGSNQQDRSLLIFCSCK